MPDRQLTHPVTDSLDNLLLDAGARLTPQRMRAFVEARPVAIRSRRLLDYRRIRSDLEAFFAQRPYDVIFGGTATKQALIDIAGQVVMPETVLESLYLFRELDFYTYRHTLLVFALSMLIARELIDDRHSLLQEVMAGPTHDIGKRCVPLHVLTKATPLTPAEVDHLRHHALAGYVLLAHYYQDPHILAARVARDHHERRDGSGYPLGIAMDNPMVDIIMVSDVYDALISPRPYRPVSFDNRTALEEITRQAESGIISDTVVRVLVALNRRSRPHFSRCVLSAERRGHPPADNHYGLVEVDADDDAK